MREIRFRGRYVFEGNDLYPDRVDEWKYGSLIIDKEGYWIKVSDDLTFKVIKETIGQLVGLQGRKGRKIYEGDVVKSIETGVVGFIDFWNGRFCWTDGACHWDLVAVGHNQTPTEEKEKKLDDLEVLGTVYENSDLLD